MVDIDGFVSSSCVAPRGQQHVIGVAGGPAGPAVAGPIISLATVYKHLENTFSSSCLPHNGLTRSMEPRNQPYDDPDNASYSRLLHIVHVHRE